MIALGYEETDVTFVQSIPRDSDLEEDKVCFKIDLGKAQIDLMVYQFLGTEYDPNIRDSRRDLKITGVAGAISMGELEKFVVEFNTKFNKIGNCLNNLDAYQDPYDGHSPRPI